MGPLGIFIITYAILRLAEWIFAQVWKLALKFFYYVLQKSVDVARKIIVATRRLGKVIFLMYKRLNNGKIYRTTYEEETLDIIDVPEGLRSELDLHEEVVVKNDNIDPSEF